MTLAVRARGTCQRGFGITNVVHEADSDVPLLNVKTMEDTVDDSLLQQRFTMFLLVGFAALALLLAAVGIYSVLSYMVRRRVREIGIRMALGAQIGDVLRMMVVEGMKPTLLGVVIGLAGALALGSVHGQRDLYSVAAVMMTAVGLLAARSRGHACRSHENAGSMEFGGRTTMPMCTKT